MRPIDFRGKQLELGQTRVTGIDLPQKSRDDIPVVLRGIQAVCANKETQAELRCMLVEFFSKEVRLDVGRPGLPLFSILVLGALKEGANMDFDGLEYTANYDGLVRQFLGFSEMSKEPLHPETVRTSMEMCTPELLQGLNQLYYNLFHAVVSSPCLNSLYAITHVRPKALRRQMRRSLQQSRPQPPRKLGGLH